MHEPDEMVEVEFWEGYARDFTEDRGAHRGRQDCRPAMQNHLRQRFLDAQGPSMKDSAARARRIENAKRYAEWQARGSALSSTGQRPL